MAIYQFSPGLRLTKLLIYYVLSQRISLYHIFIFVFYLSAYLEVYINEPAINKNVRQIRYKASTLIGNNKVAWLLKAISLIDLTTLNSDDTNHNVAQLCKKVHYIVSFNFSN